MIDRGVRRDVLQVGQAADVGVSKFPMFRLAVCIGISIDIIIVLW